jgi:bifunctional non-homologous end joining protein LigD
MSLKKYHAKRDFTITSEPKGKSKVKRSNALYVIQKHAASHLHYDLRLEMNGVLKSWAVPKGPCLDPHVKRLAIQVEDHPIEYGEFQGVIPQGQYGGGTVLLWDKGTWQTQGLSAVKDFNEGNLTFYLHGKKLQGLWKLIRDKNDKTKWLFFKLNDEYARPINEHDIIILQPNSVLDHQSLDQIEKKYRLK